MNIFVLYHVFSLAICKETVSVLRHKDFLQQMTMGDRTNIQSSPNCKERVVCPTNPFALIQKYLRYLMNNPDEF